MKTIKEKILEETDRPIVGHPSREEAARIIQLEKLIILLAEELDKVKRLMQKHQIR